MNVRSATTGLRREWRLAIADPRVPMMLLIIGGLTLLALLTASQRVSHRLERQQDLESYNARQRQFLESAYNESSLTNSSAGELTPSEQDRRLQLQMSARSPDLMRFTGGIWWTILPASPIAGLSMGAGGEWPDHYYHAGPSQTQTLRRLMRPNPLLAAVGAFDLTLLVGAMLPLGVIILTYDVAAAEREQGRWELVRSHVASIPRLIVARCLVRTGALAVVIIALTALCSLMFPTGQWDAQAMRNLFAWSAWVSGYVMFWTALAVLINSLQLSSAGAGLLFLLCWCFLVLAVPSLLERGINGAIRMAPESELVAMEDEVRIQAEQEADAAWADFQRQHPEIKLDEDNPQQEQMLRNVALSRVIQSRVQIQIARYFQRFVDREFLLDRWQLLSPLLAWRTAADQFAGTSLRHFVSFSEKTAAFHTEYVSYFESKSLAGEEVLLSDIQAIPSFDAAGLQTHLYRQSLLLSAATLMLWTTACGLLSWRCFHGGAR